MAVMGPGVKCGQMVEVKIFGQDEDMAYDSMRHFLKIIFR